MANQRKVKPGSFQEKQLNILGSLEKSFQESLDISKSLQTNIDKTAQLLDSMISKNFKEASESVRGLSNSTHSYENMILRSARAEVEYHKKREELFNTFAKKATDILENIGKIANNYSAISNSLLKSTGATGDQVRDTRSTIVHDIVNELNKETGLFFNPEEAYKEIASIANSQGIGNTNAIEELTRPLLLAQESMNINTSNLATIFNKFYTRYTFTSMEMEGLVDEIRGNTSNNNATAEDTLKSWERLETMIMSVANGNKELEQDLMSAISGGSSWLAAMNLDPDKYAEDIYKIFSGEAYSDRRLLQIFGSEGGISKAKNLLNSEEGIKEIYRILAEGDARFYQSNLIGEELPKIVSENLGYELDQVIRANSALSSPKTKTLDEFIEEAKNAPGAIEVVESQYVSLEDKTKNFFNRFNEYAAWMQENIGVGFSDIAIILGSLYTAVASGKVLNSSSKLLSGLLKGGTVAAGGAAVGSATASTAAGATAAGSAAAGGTAVAAGGTAAVAAPVAAVIAAVVNAGFGLKVMYDKTKIVLDEDASAVEKSIAGFTAMVTALNPMFGSAIFFLDKAAHKIYDINTKYGMADQLMAEYTAERTRILGEIEDEERILREIKGGLQVGADAQELATQLIESGILKEEDQQIALQLAKDNNIDALTELTDSYLRAKQSFSEEFETEFNRLEQESLINAKAYQKELTDQFQEWNDKKQWNKDKLQAVNDVMYSMYKDLSSRDNLSKDDKKFLKVLEKQFVKGDGRIDTAKEANALIDAGFFNKAFQNASMSSEIARSSAYLMASSNDAEVSALGKSLASYEIQTAQEIAKSAQEKADEIVKYNPAKEALEYNETEAQKATSGISNGFDSLAKEMSVIKEAILGWKDDTSKRDSADRLKYREILGGRLVNSYLASNQLS